MDVSGHDELRTAPQIVFEALPGRRDTPRFMVRREGAWTPVTWQSFADQVRHIGLYAADRLMPGERGAVFAANSVSWLSAALGIQSARGVMVPVYGSSTADQLQHIIEHSDVKLVFVDASTLPRMLEVCGALPQTIHVVLIDESAPPDSADSCCSWADAIETGRSEQARAPERFERLVGDATLDEDAIMLYTSGTSGPPKGVPLTHRNLSVNARDWFESNAPLLDEGYLDLLWLPMSHIFGFGEAAIGNRLGWVSYLSDPKSVLDDLREVRPNVLMSVPSVWEKLAKAALAHPDPGAELTRLTGGDLRFCLSGGAGLKPAVKEFFWREGILIIEGYGLTECSPTLTLNRPDAFRFDSVGQAFPSVELRLADDGEILARGESVFRGYHNDPEATRAAFDEDGWFMTGDIGRWTEDGFLQIVDRKKDILVTSGGKNIAPANIEREFQSDPLIAHVVVYGDGEKYLVAALWLNENEHAADERVKLAQARVDVVNQRLPRHETIKKFLLIDEPLSVESGLLTPTLKVRRKHVYARYGDSLKTLYGGSP